MNQRCSEAGASLIGIIIAAAIVCLLVLAGARIYMGERQELDKETVEALEESGIQTDSDGAVLNSAKQRAAEYEKTIQLRNMDLGQAR